MQVILDLPPPTRSRPLLQLMARSLVIPTIQLLQDRKKRGYGSHRNSLDLLARHTGRRWALLAGNAFSLTSVAHIRITLRTPKPYYEVIARSRAVSVCGRSLCAEPA